MPDINSEKLERLEKWVDSNLKQKPKHQGLKETKDLIKLYRQNVLEKQNINNAINKALTLLEQIKIGNTPKYQKVKDEIVSLLQNVLKKE